MAKMAYNIYKGERGEGGERRMAKAVYQGKKYDCFTDEQQKFYDKLPIKQKKYVDFRGQGFPKTKSYTMAGYDGKAVAQLAHQLEKRNQGIAELVSVLLKQNRAKTLMEDDGVLSRRVNALALQKNADRLIESIEGADGETALQIKFYRDIVEGKTKTVRITKRLNTAGGLIEKKVEYVSDLETRIKARKELDKILGLNKGITLENFQVGNITVNIVDASMDENEEGDSRDKITLDNVQVVDDETVVVVDETEETVGDENEH